MLLLLLMLLMCPSSALGETFWAYVPDPPILHPSVWEGPEIPVYVNNTHALGLPSSGHIDWKTKKGFNYTGYGTGLPVCISNNVSVTGCLRSSYVTLYTSNSQIGWNVRLNLLGDWSGGQKVKAKMPQSLLPCDEEIGLSAEAVPWKRCHGNMPVRYNIPGMNRYILDWSQSNKMSWMRGLASGIWKSDTQYQQNFLWKLAGAMGENFQTVTVCRPDTPCTSTSCSVNVSACVPSPYVLLVGNLSITFNGLRFYVSCYNCTLTNCVSWVPLGTRLMIFHQPSFVMLPVNVSGPWYDERSLQILKEIEYALSRPKRFIGLLIAGIMALVTLIATATTAAVALSQSVQNAHYVNTLSKNVTLALGTQEDIDKKLEQKVNALYDMVQYLDDKIQSLKVWSRLRCHSEYHWICVTPKIYNSSQHDWNRVRLHLQGIWHNANLSLDMFRLHDDIQNMREAEPLKFDAAQAASQFVDMMKKALLSMPNIAHSVVTFLTLGICVCLVLCLLPALIRCFLKQMRKVQANIHEIKLKAKSQAQSPAY